MGEGEDGGVAVEHLEEGAVGGEGEVMAAASEDFEGEEVLGFGEEEGRELADEPEVVVGGRMAVEGREADEF